MNLSYNNFNFKTLNNDELKLTGYASVFNHLDHHNDIITKGAFAQSIAKHSQGYRIKFLWQHDQTKPIGIINHLTEDDNGLLVEASINNTITQGKEVISLIKQKAIDSLSIGFNIEESETTDKGQRRILKANLWEVSIVTFPANAQARIEQFNNNHLLNHANPRLLELLSITSKSIFII